MCEQMSNVRRRREMKERGGGMGGSESPGLFDWGDPNG